MASVKKHVDVADLAVAIRTKEDQLICTVVHRADGFVIAQNAPIENPAFVLELTRVLASFGIEPEHDIGATRDELERERAHAVRELGELKGLFHQEQTLTGELTEKVAELEGEKASLSHRLAGVERERSELAARVAAYDNAAREMSRMSAAREAGEDEQPKTNPGGRPVPP